MALSPTKITPVLDPNCLDSSDAASEVYPPQPGTTTTANDVGAGEQILRNQTHTLNEVKADVAGDTFTGLVIFDAGAEVTSGQELNLDGVGVLGTVGFSALGQLWAAGRKRLWRPRNSVSDASQTIGLAANADRFDLPANNAAPRTITLQHSAGTIPDAGETLTFFWNPGTGGGGGTQYTFQREDTTVIATFVGAQVADTGAVYAEFEYTAGGWRLGTHSGTPNEYTPGPDTWMSYGVVPGAGA